MKTNPLLTLNPYLITIGALMLLIGSSYVAIDLVPPVPITAQTLVVLLLGFILGAKWGGGIVLLYLIVGAVGLPVFAKGAHGWEVFSSNTGGYLFGFLIATIFVGSIKERVTTDFIKIFGLHILGTLIILILGASWLAYLKGISVGFHYGFLPYLIGGLIKCMLGSVIVHQYHIKKKDNR